MSGQAKISSFFTQSTKRAISTPGEATVKMNVRNLAQMILEVGIYEYTYNLVDYLRMYKVRCVFIY